MKLNCCLACCCLHSFHFLAVWACCGLSSFFAEHWRPAAAHNPQRNKQPHQPGLTALIPQFNFTKSIKLKLILIYLFGLLNWNGSLTHLCFIVHQPIIPFHFIIAFFSIRKGQPQPQQTSFLHPAHSEELEWKEKKCCWWRAASSSSAVHSKLSIIDSIDSITFHQFHQ